MSSFRDARLEVRGAVLPPVVPPRQPSRQTSQRVQDSSRGAFIHVLKRSIGDVNIPLALPAPAEKKNSSYVSKYADFTRQFAGALRDAQKTQSVTQPSAAQSSAASSPVVQPSVVAPVHTERRKQDHERLTAALQSSLNRVSRAPVVLSTAYMRPVKEHATESDAELKQAMKSLFGEEQSVFVSRANASGVAAPAVPFWQRTIEIRPFAFLQKLFNQEHLQRRSLLLQQLKEVHYGKNNRSHLN